MKHAFIAILAGLFLSPPAIRAIALDDTYTILPHIATGSSWQTKIYLLNPSSRVEGVVVDFNFYGDDGLPLELPLFVAGSGAGAPREGALNNPVTFEPGAYVAGTSTAVHVRVPPHGTILIATDGTYGSPLLQGWGQLVYRTPGTVIATALLQQRLARSPEPVYREATVHSSSRYTPDALMLYTKSAGLALVNPDPSGALTATLTFYDQAGAVSATDQIALSPRQHMAFSFADRYPALTDGALLRVSSDRKGVAFIGFRFAGAGIFTTLMPIEELDPAVP